jgi:AcrR family transcriptional regulator
MKETRKEALAKFHRDNIIKAAERLFIAKGIENTSMDDIASESGYSKATLYVYFKNKEEIVGHITLTGMNILLDIVRKCIAGHDDFRSQYFALCYAIVDFKEKQPFHCDNILKEINVDLELEETPKIYHEIYAAGERINAELLNMFQRGADQGAVRDDIKLPQATFVIWASILGIIRMAAQKNKYFSKCLRINQQDFLQYSFELLYRSIQK